MQPHPVQLGNLEKVKYHDIFDQTPRYRYCHDIVDLTVHALTKYVNNFSSDFEEFEQNHSSAVQELVPGIVA